MRSSLRNLLIGWLAVVFVFAGLPAQAGMIGTEQLVTAGSRDASLSTITQFMARDDVQQQLQVWGVEPVQAADRVAQLSDTELQRLALNIDSQPAGAGALAVIGVVFLVLLILELVGVINVFQRI